MAADVRNHHTSCIFHKQLPVYAQSRLQVLLRSVVVSDSVKPRSQPSPGGRSRAGAEPSPCYTTSQLHLANLTWHYRDVSHHRWGCFHRGSQRSSAPQCFCLPLTVKA